MIHHDLHCKNTIIDVRN